MHARGSAGRVMQKARLIAELKAARRTVAELEEALGQQSSASATSAMRSRCLFDSNVAGIMICDLHGSVSEANDAFLGMLGHERDDLPLRWDRMTPPAWHGLDEARVEEVLSSGAAVVWETELIARGGHRVPVLVALAIEDASRGRCVAIVHDLSKRVRLEGVLRRREARNRTPYEDIPLPASKGVTRRRQAEQEAIERKEELRALTASLGLAEERERRRIALGLHDDVGHTLALAKLLLGRSPGSDPSSEAASAGTIREVTGLLDQAIGATRSLTFELSSPVLYELGLEAALENLGEEMEHRHGIRFEFQAEKRSRPMADDLTVVLYRILRELFSNVAKHARARRVGLRVRTTADEIHVALEDDGVGFDVSKAGGSFGPGGGFGLLSIRAQLDHLGGRMDLESSPGRGTRAVVVAPLAAIADRGT